MRSCIPLSLLAMVACADRDPTHACSAKGATAPCIRVLFIGNSYTFANDLPDVVRDLAHADGRDIVAAMAANPGSTLDDHARSGPTRSLIESRKWDYIVIQEQSLIPSVEPSRTTVMFPAVRTLVQRARSAGATPLLFQTWARRDGWPERGLAGFAQMQAAIDSGYDIIGKELGVTVVRVGDAWAEARARNPSVDLWQADGSHPSITGTKLAGCAFYTAFTQRSCPAH